VIGVDTDPDLELRLKDEVDDLTARCLTTPFQRSLLRCVDEGGQLSACFAMHGLRIQRAPRLPSGPLIPPEL
jgi:hypothetical protein